MSGRLRNHVVFAAITSGVICGVVVLTAGERPVARLSTATAYASLALLVFVLVLGPINVMRGRQNPVSSDLRRDAGIWAASLGIVHVVLGLQVHMSGRMAHYFVYPPGRWSVMPLRFDAFGIANYTGLFAAIILLILLAVSNDLSLRRLGARLWKTVQRANYLGMVLIIVHGAVYQLLEKRRLDFVVLFATLVLAAFWWQVAAYRKTTREAVRRAHRTDGGR